MFYLTSCIPTHQGWRGTGLHQLLATFFHTDHVLSPPTMMKHIFHPLLRWQANYAEPGGTHACSGQNLLSCLNASCASVLVHNLCIQRINLTTQIYEEKSRLCITHSAVSRLNTHLVAMPFFLNKLNWLHWLSVRLRFSLSEKNHAQKLRMNCI